MILSLSARTVFCAILLASATWALSSDSPAPEFAQDDPARIWIEGDTLYYYGSISEGSLRQFERFVSSEDTSNIRTFEMISIALLRIAENPRMILPTIERDFSISNSCRHSTTFYLDQLGNWVLRIADRALHTARAHARARKTV